MSLSVHFFATARLLSAVTKPAQARGKPYPSIHPQFQVHLLLPFSWSSYHPKEALLKGKVSFAREGPRQLRQPYLIPFLQYIFLQPEIPVRSSRKACAEGRGPKPLTEGCCMQQSSHHAQQQEKEKGGWIKLFSVAPVYSIEDVDPSCCTTC